jgi:nitrate/TMAO reductase-like tetraheme cytochrome c subunit
VWDNIALSISLSWSIVVGGLPSQSFGFMSSHASTRLLLYSCVVIDSVLQEIGCTVVEWIHLAQVRGLVAASCEHCMNGMIC